MGKLIGNYVLGILLPLGVLGATMADKENPLLTPRQSSTPTYQMAAHHINKMNMVVCNDGTLGINYTQAARIDVFDGSQPEVTCEYPRFSEHTYVFGATLWVGGKVNGETRVSTGADGWGTGAQEFKPGDFPVGFMRKRSRLSSDPGIRDGAISDEDLLAEYADTASTPLSLDHPLGLQITQTSYAWADSLVEDFIIIQYFIKNISPTIIDSTYVGVFVDGDAEWVGNSQGYTDDLSGFEQALVVEGYDHVYDTVSFAWLADNNGDPTGNAFTTQSCTDITGITVLQLPSLQSQVSYNWWYPDNSCETIGPHHVSDTTTWIHTESSPLSDAQKYHLLSNGEVDPDPIHFMMLPTTDTLWAKYSQNCQYRSFGDARYLLSVGPFNLQPGDSVPFTIACVGGEHFHTAPRTITNPPANPASYWSGLDFSDIARNALRARQKFANKIDPDEDDIANQYDNCPNIANPLQIDVDHNGIGDVCQCSGNRGDVNGDNKENPDVTDLTYLVRCLFILSDGFYPFPLEADVNGDARMNILDVVALVRYLFADGMSPAPCPSAVTNQ